MQSGIPQRQPVLLHVLPETGDDSQGQDRLTQSLTAAVAMRDVESCWPLEPEEAPDDAKGLGVLLGWVAVHLSLQNLRQVVRAVVDWASRNSRDVEIRYGKDVIIVTRVTSKQQEKLIDAWIDRHSRS